MKNIIFEVIHTLLLTKKSASPLLLPTSFSQRAVQALIEQINLFGMSVDKFKRTLRLLLVEHFYDNSYFIMHRAVFDQSSTLAHPHFKSSKFTTSVFRRHEAAIKQRFSENLRVVMSGLGYTEE